MAIDVCRSAPQMMHDTDRSEREQSFRDGNSVVLTPEVP